MIGGLLFIMLMTRIGPTTIVSSFARLSWRLVVIIAFPFVLINVFDTLGWRFAFPDTHVPFRTLWWARLAGEALNVTTPTASVGGEPVKAWLIRPHAPMDESLSSVIIAKTTITIAQALLLLVGIAIAWTIFPLPSRVLVGMELLLALEVLAVGGFVVAQSFGAVGWSGRMLRRFESLGGDRLSSPLASVDSTLASFYRNRPRRLALSIGCHFVGWLLSAFEAYVILHALGLDVSINTAILIEAFGAGIRFASFMVPAHLGALEGGHVAMFVALGLSASSGLTFTLVRRVREVAWTIIGLICLTALGIPTSSVPATLTHEA